MTPIYLLTMVQHGLKRKTITHPSIIWSPSPSWRTDQFKDIHLFFCARRVWTFHCILIHVSPLLLSHYLSNMNFVSKGPFSLYSNENILLAIFLSSHIISPTPKILYKMAFDFLYLFYNRHSVKLRENKSLLPEASFSDWECIESICLALSPPNLNITLKWKLSLEDGDIWSE